MAHARYELYVQLRKVAPPVWRTIEIAGSATLEDVHFAIQLAMGWNNSHLHQFTIGKASYGMIDLDEHPGLKDERQFALQDVAKYGVPFEYEYDFGDGWEHDVTVRAIEASTKPVRPRCIGGARACPPDDCGGPAGYLSMLEAAADPKHPQHQQMIAWIPKGFDPERFVASKKDLTNAIEALRKLAEQPDEGEDVVVDGLPRSLVEAAIQLPPMQRASLVALLAASLAEDVHTAVAMQNRPKRHGHVTDASRRTRRNG